MMRKVILIVLVLCSIILFVETMYILKHIHPPENHIGDEVIPETITNLIEISTIGLILALINLVKRWGTKLSFVWSLIIIVYSSVLAIIFFILVKQNIVVPYSEWIKINGA